MAGNPSRGCSPMPPTPPLPPDPTGSESPPPDCEDTPRYQPKFLINMIQKFNMSVTREQLAVMERTFVVMVSTFLNSVCTRLYSLLATAPTQYIY